MRVIVFIGSRDPAGRTSQAANALIEGLLAGGAVADPVRLLDHDIRMCIQRGQDGFGDCLAKGVCKLEDEFEPLVQRMRDADLAVFVTPVYWGEISEIMRAFLDRLRRICLHDDGKRGISGKPAVAVCVAGGGGGGSPHSAETMNRILSHCGIDVLDVIPARRQNFDLKLQVLQVTGRWLAGRAVAVNGAPKSPA